MSTTAEPVRTPIPATRGVRLRAFRRRRRVRRAATAAASLVLAVAVAAFGFLAVGPRLFGYQTATMLTGSMSPGINPGDVVVTVAKPAAEVKTGDIITYYIPVEDHRMETHRVVEVLRNADGSVAVRTKGDHNNAADPWTATVQGSSVDEVVLVVPFLGQAIRTLREPLVRDLLLFGAPLLLVSGGLAMIWRRPARGGPDDGGSTGDIAAGTPA
ncbi:signal peptidase I [Paenarthrobacter sp. DKR-5]|uniref:signal peptidase I n=1 Tax=Paenarthrobacter sp. DKR-5 TaxID=2835535 RepID=UPI001BDC27D9|nr:signal peptidase I [Paenarthrobacter sp. DKR-5]MBT1004409.1 signal peptidase I [Paenarthrobacter sp. DKR-5]